MTSCPAPAPRSSNRLHRLLAELVPGGARRDLSSFKARRTLAAVRLGDLGGRARRQLAADLVGERATVDRTLEELKKRPASAVLESGSQLVDILADRPRRRGPHPRRHRPLPRPQPRRVPTGAAPIDASSGEQIRHRLSRAGNHRLNHVRYMADIVAMRHDTEGRAHHRRTLADGKTPTEAMRCPRRRLSDIVYRQLVADTEHAAAATARQLERPGRAPRGDCSIQRGRPSTATPHPSSTAAPRTLGTGDLVWQWASRSSPGWRCSST